jgi:Na+/phosphate symporter
MMKTVLLFIVILAYMGGIISTAKFFVAGQLHFGMIISLITLISFNIFCARYLYKKANTSKSEWALFGSIGNITALLIFWFFNNLLTNWSRGKRNFS